MARPEPSLGNRPVASGAAAPVPIDKREGQPAGVPDWLLHLKLRLQFTGWLQYLPPILGAAVFLLLAGGLSLVGAVPRALVGIALGIGVALLALALFEVVAIKFGVRPAERVPPPLDGLDAFELMRARRSCRSFQRRDLSDEHREAILASARAHSAPEARLGESAIRFEYVAAPLTVWPVVNAHEFLVAIGPRSYDRTAVLDVGRGLQHVVLDATRMGVATCWIGPGADHASILRQLGERFDDAVDHIVCVCALGYRSRYVPTLVRLLTRTMHWRLPLDELFFADPELRSPLDTEAPPFASFGRCFEACQWSPSSYNGQTTRAVGVATPQGVRIDFYAATASRYYAPVALGIWCANWERGCRALGVSGRLELASPEPRPTGAGLEVPHHDVSWIAAA